MRTIFLSVLFILGPFVAAKESAQWTAVKNHAFSFSMPATFVKTDARPVDSFCEEYIGDGIVLGFDFGKYSGDFNGWPKDARYEKVKIQGRAARIGVEKGTYQNNFPYFTMMHVKLDQVALNIYAACRSEAELAIAREIFLSVVFTEEGAKAKP